MCDCGTQNTAVKIAWILLDGASIAYVCAMASTRWITQWTPKSHITKGGLWLICMTDTTTNEQQCGDAKDMIGFSRTAEWVKGAQALCILGIVLLLLAAVLINCYMFLNGVRQSISLIYVTMLMTFSSAILTWLGVLIFGVRLRTDIPMAKVNWGYGMCVTAGILTAIASVFLLAEFIYLQGMRTNKHQFRRHQQRQMIAGAMRPGSSTGGTPQGPLTGQSEHPV